MRLIPRLLPGRLQSDAMWFAAAQVFYKINGIILVVLLSRRLDEAEVGIYFFAVSFAESFLLLSNWNLNTVMMRRVARDPGRGGDNLGRLLAVRAASAPLYLAAVMIAAFFVARDVWRVITIAAVFTLLQDVYFSYASYFVGRSRVTLNVAVGMTTQTIYLAAVVAVLWYAPSLEAFLNLNVARAIFLLLLAMWIARRVFGASPIGWDASLLREGMPFLLMSFIGILRGRIDTLLLGKLIDYETVAHYQYAYQLVVGAYFLTSVVGVVFFPQLAARGLDAENRFVLVRGTQLLAGIGVLGTVFTFLTADWITGMLYRETAQHVAPLVKPLGVLFPLVFVDRMLTSSLQALHQERRVLRVSIAGTVLSVATNVALIPLWGAYGAVAAQIVSTSGRLLMLIAPIRRMLAEAAAEEASDAPAPVSME